LILGGEANQFFDIVAMRETASAIPAAKLQPPTAKPIFCRWTG